MKGDKHDVIVVGGGLCGLRAAEILRSQGANVLLLEASDKLGGSAGCQKTVSSDSAGLLQLAASLNVPTIRISHEKLLKTLELSNSTLRFTGGVATALPWLAHLDLNHLFRRTDLLSTKVPPDAPWRAAESGSWDTESVLGWLQREGWNAEARRVYATLVRVALADDPANVSLLYWLWICRMAGGFRRLFAEYDLEKIHPEGGVAGIIDALTNTVGKDRIRLGCQVTEVDWSHPRHVTLVCNQREDDQLKDVLGPVERFCARYVIFALPPSQLCCGLEFRPPLPEYRRKTCACIRASRVLRLELTYAESFWLARGLGGFFASEPGPVSHGLPSALAPDKLICYVVGAEAERLAAVAPAQRQQAVCAHLARIFDCADALRPVSITEADSASTQLTRRDHPYVLAPGALTGGSVASFWEPLGGRVFFANTLMAAVWPQHLEGALQVAERVANDVFLRFSQTDGRGKVFLRRQASYPAAGIDPTSPRTAAIDLDQQPPPMPLPPPAAESDSAEKPPAPDEQSACLQEWQASPGLPSLNDLVRYSAAVAALVASGLILWRRAHV